MTAPRPLDPDRPLGPGRTIIEASAGTGKTYTIAGYVTRLIAEEGIPIDRILVVTFTRAATAELRDRIRKRIVGTLRTLAGSTPADPETGDAHLTELADADPEKRSTMVQRLADALIQFDRAAVFTLHGFSLRLLDQLGFHARISAELEPVDVDASLIRETAADLIVARFADAADGAVTERELTAVGRTVTVNPDAVIVPPPATGGPAGLRSELAHAMRREVDRRLRERGSAAYDRFLIEARDALTAPDVGDAARRILRSRYDVALVDEAQDTDPIQWQIIRSVFDDRRLVVIGDPKQAIYAFRGADIEAYLSAVEGADDRLTLTTNWRSDGPLVDALDTLFDGVTFGDDRIAYRKVEAASGHIAPRMHGPGAPLTIRRFSPDAPIRTIRNGKFSKPAARDVVAADVADGVVRFLGSGQTIVGDGGERPLHPGDIAILCRTRNQVGLVRTELERRGVPSVAARSGAVLTSPAAEQWLWFLRGVERPSRNAAVRLAASTLLVGVPLADIADLDDEALLDLRLEMQRMNDILNDTGVPSLVADLDRTTGLAARVLREPDGERTMTDLLHLAEMMHTAWRRGGIGSLAAWLETQMIEAEADERERADAPESRQRRLETDASAVQVQTIHASKGLQYPVVLVPFLWDKPTLPKSAIVVPVFHDPDAETQPSGDPRRRFVDVGISVWPEYRRHVALSDAEGTAEESRLLYVALTRAEHRLVVWWIDHASEADQTNLHRILTRHAPEPGSTDLAALIERAAGTIKETYLVTTPGTARYEPAEGPDRRPLEIASFDRTIDRTWRRVSFTSLSPDHPVAAAADHAEGTVRDDEAELDDPEEIADVVPDAGEGKTPLGAMPRGAAFGTLVHNVLEHVPFDDPDLETALRTEIARSAGPGWDLDRDTLAAGLAAALATPLGPRDDDLALADIPDRRTLKEMVFEFPVRTGAEPWSVAGIAEVMALHLPASDPRRRYAERLAAEHADPFRGYLVGAIDYTAIVPGPDGGDRYVVMDYKTNTLPAVGDTPAPTDYRAGPLAEAMEHSHYLLQAILYQVALHRYLQWRLPGYDPHRNLGGARYLFVRGMTGPDTPVVDGERCGVYRWEPPADLIVDLSRRFVEGDRR